MASIPADERLKDDTWNARMKNRDRGLLNNSCLPMKYRGLGMVATKSGGSFKDMWLQTTISGPFGGTHSAPSISKRPKALKHNWPSPLPKR